jgi:hypothetical protein
LSYNDSDESSDESGDSEEDSDSEDEACPLEKTMLSDSGLHDKKGDEKAAAASTSGGRRVKFGRQPRQLRGAAASTSGGSRVNFGEQPRQLRAAAASTSGSDESGDSGEDSDSEDEACPLEKTMLSDNGLYDKKGNESGEHVSNDASNKLIELPYEQVQVNFIDMHLLFQPEGPINSLVHILVTFCFISMGLT